MNPGQSDETLPEVTPAEETPAGLRPGPPRARIEALGGFSWARLLPLAALGLAALLLVRSWQERGPRLLLRAAEGHGLEAGDALRHRGIDVGRVEFVRLARAGQGIAIGVQLERSAEGLARVGSRFWIVRPVLGLEGASGLETLLGGPYLAVDPGPPAGERSEEFSVLGDPPLFELEDAGALEIVLMASDRGGLAPGAPITYRDVPIGTVVSVGLARDASEVEARALVAATYVELVREDSRFWRRPGAELSLGLSGARMEIGSLRSLWAGGVALATPTNPGRRAVTGQRFALAPKADEDWLEWRPSLGLGGALLPDGAAAPEPAWARLSWEESGWFGSERAASGWLTVLADGSWLGPRELLLAPAKGEAESVALECAGQRLTLDPPAPWNDAHLARWRSPGPALEQRPAARRRTLEGPEDCLVFGDPGRAPVALADLVLGPEGSLSSGFSFDERWHGAPVIARSDGALVGVLLVRAGEARVVPVPVEEK